MNLPPDERDEAARQIAQAKQRAYDEFLSGKTGRSARRAATRAERLRARKVRKAAAK